MTPQRLRLLMPASPWLDDALARVVGEPATILVLFPAAGRHCGRAPLAQAPGWTGDTAARARLLLAVPLGGGALAAVVRDLYQHGDAAERRAVLRCLHWLDVGEGCVELLRDALRTNDPRLVEAAMGPAAAALDGAAWRQGVLKCVFMGIPLAAVDGLVRRADGELAGMLADLAAELLAAGRRLPDDAAALLTRLTAATHAGSPRPDRLTPEEVA
jgi:hypothetical protein